MKLSISCITFLSYLMLVSPLYAGTQTLSTYYPAPQGNYLNMTVNNQLTLTPGACVPGGNVAIANVGGILEICDASGSYFLTNTSLWSNNSGNIFPTNTPTGETVSIGTITNPNGYSLNVGNTLGVGGNANIASATIVGDTTSATLEVSGAATAGSLGVSGLTTSGTLTVSGATILNSGVTVNGAIATFSNGASVTGGNLGLYNGTTSIQYWNGAVSSLKPLVVAEGSDHNYYAAYGP